MAPLALTISVVSCSAVSTVSVAVPNVGHTPDGRLEVFGCDGDLAHTWQDLGSDTLWWKGAFDNGPLGLGPPLQISSPPDTLGSPGSFPELLPWN
jgi:hypothetical protein